MHVITYDKVQVQRSFTSCRQGQAPVRAAPLAQAVVYPQPSPQVMALTKTWTHRLADPSSDHIQLTAETSNVTATQGKQ